MSEPDDPKPPPASLGGASLTRSLLDRLAVEPSLELDQAPGVATGAADPGPGAERYTLLELLGEGAFGRVYRALDRDLRRELAIKVLKPSADGAALDIKRFVEEAQATAQMEHPNIIPLHELGVAGDSLYYTMKLVRGQTLAKVLAGLRAGNPETTREWGVTRLVQVFLQVCQAIRFAHVKGVVHRDLKPHNIMLGDYGEVILMDWGLAKVVVQGQVRTEGLLAKAHDGAILGSPAYMAPEQASGESEATDARTDVWSLGVILYELLTLELPFESDNTAWLLAKILLDEPVAPRRRAPHRDIPLELERICLQALSKRPAERQESAGQMRDQVQSWLEAELERGRRRALAESKAAEGVAAVAAWRRLQGEVAELEDKARRLKQQFKPWQSLEQKRELLDSIRMLEQRTRSLDRAFGDAVALLTTAVGLESENRMAREALAELHWDRFREAERREDERAMAYLRPLVELYHDGRYRIELEGSGSLELSSDPPGAEVWLYEYVEEDVPLVEARERSLGRTPLPATALPMASYLVVLRAPGYRDVRYPVFIGRNHRWSGHVNLYREDEIGADFLYVPAGPFIQGGEEDELTWALPRSKPYLEDYFIARDPVTMAQYIEYLNDIGHQDPKQALARSPRRHDEGDIYLILGPDGRLQLPEVDAEGDRWEPRWPVVGISWYDAVAYAEWRSARDGLALRLPTDSEWEKAARGVDGRSYPWGHRFDASLCNMKGSRRERASPSTVDEFPGDLSPYGVRGMAGNVRDWTALHTLSGEGQTARAYYIIRGGCWGFGPLGLKSPMRFAVSPTLVDGQLGFRLARTAPRASQTGGPTAETVGPER